MEIKLMPKDFEEYAEARRNGFMKAKKMNQKTRSLLMGFKNTPSGRPSMGHSGGRQARN